MSVHNQRGKVRKRTRIKPAPVNAGLGIFSSTELTYWLGRHALGNIGEVTTVDGEKILGLIRAISPGGDMGLTYAYTAQKTKNGHIHASDITVPMSGWKMVRVPNIKLTDGLLGLFLVLCNVRLPGEVKIDAESAPETDSIDPIANERELVPFFGSSDAVQDCVLDQGGFPAEEMFKTNKELFSVASTYNPELTEYTTAVDRSAPNFSETEARCAQLARDIEGSQQATVSLEEACDDEEMAFSAVVRTRDHLSQNTQSLRKVGISQEHDNGIRSEYTEVCVQSDRTVLTGSNGSVDITGTTGSAKSDIHTPKPPEPPEKSAPVEEKSPDAPAPENADLNTTTCTPVITEEKVKKSTLDPNAPEFQPLSLQYASLAQQPQLQQVMHAAPYTPPIAVHSVASSQLTMPTLQTFVATGQPQAYAPTSIPYNPHSGPIPHLIPGSLAGNNMQQPTRGGSLPPSIHQQHFSSINPQAGLLLQQSQQPGLSLPQLITSQPPLITGPSPGNRFSGPPSSIAHAHQRSDTSATHSTAYGIPQADVSVSTLQHPLYQIPHSGPTIPLWVTGHPPVGLHFISGAGGSTPLMVGNLPLSQASGQQLYPTHAMLHMHPTQLSVQVQVPQAPPSTTPQQSQTQQVFQASGPFQDHPQHIQLPAYAANMLSSQQGGAPNYYSSPPAVLTGPNPTSATVQPGLLPLVNRNSAHAVSGNVGHPPPNMDPAMLSAQIPNTQFTQQPTELIQQLAAAHLMHAQLAAGQHANSQPFQHRAYQTLAAMAANTNNPSSQSH